MLAWVHLIRFGCAAVAAGELLAGCATGPAPIAIYESRQESVWLHFDPKAGTGHSHPASITPEHMTAVLKGIRVKNRDVAGGFDLLSDKDSAPAFSTAEILALAPHLSLAFKKASPSQIATFYLTTQDFTRGALVTSGGLFVRNQHLYIIVANVRTSPSSIQYENTYELDTKDQPLLPIARFKFTVGFIPSEIRVPTGTARSADGYPSYLDDSKLVVIDLPRLLSGEDAAVTPK
jgi:hypothetical protein